METETRLNMRWIAHAKERTVQHAPNVYGASLVSAWTDAGKKTAVVAASASIVQGAWPVGAMKTGRFFSYTSNQFLTFRKHQSLTASRSYRPQNSETTNLVTNALGVDLSFNVICQFIGSFAGRCRSQCGWRDTGRPAELTMRHAKDDLASTVVPAIQRIIRGHDMKQCVVIGLKLKGCRKIKGFYSNNLGRHWSQRDNQTQICRTNSRIVDCDLPSPAHN